jgi:hypothetical protein
MHARAVPLPRRGVAPRAGLTPRRHRAGPRPCGQQRQPVGRRPRPARQVQPAVAEAESGVTLTMPMISVRLPSENGPAVCRRHLRRASGTPRAGHVRHHAPRPCGGSCRRAGAPWPRRGCGAQLAAHRGRDRARAGLLHPAHRHAQVLGTRRRRCALGPRGVRRARRPPAWSAAPAPAAAWRSTSTSRAILDSPVTLPSLAGMYPTWATPWKGTRWCSHRCCRPRCRARGSARRGRCRRSFQDVARVLVESGEELAVRPGHPGRGVPQALPFGVLADARAAARGRQPPHGPGRPGGCRLGSPGQCPTLPRAEVSMTATGGCSSRVAWHRGNVTVARSPRASAGVRTGGRSLTPRRSLDSQVGRSSA